MGVLAWHTRSAPVRYRFEVTGPIPLKTDIVVEGDQARLEPVEAAQANVTFRCDGALRPLALRTPHPASCHCSGSHCGRR